MYVCMYVRMYVCMYVCIHTYVHTHIYLYTHTEKNTMNTYWRISGIYAIWLKGCGREQGMADLVGGRHGAGAGGQAFREFRGLRGFRV